MLNNFLIEKLIIAVLRLTLHRITFLNKKMSIQLLIEDSGLHPSSKAFKVIKEYPCEQAFGSDSPKSFVRKTNFVNDGSLDVALSIKINFPVFVFCFKIELYQ